MKYVLWMVVAVPMMLVVVIGLTTPQEMGGMDPEIKERCKQVLRSTALDGDFAKDHTPGDIILWSVLVKKANVELDDVSPVFRVVFDTGSHGKIFLGKINVVGKSFDGQQTLEAIPEFTVCLSPKDPGDSFSVRFPLIDYDAGYEFSDDGKIWRDFKTNFDIVKFRRVYVNDLADNYSH